jgi:hypothetical protein
MNRILAAGVVAGLGAAALSCADKPRAASPAAGAPDGFDAAQVPEWTRDDFEFFLHGSMSTEVVPERVFKAFRATYPDLFPGDGFAAFGLVENGDGAPVGLSRGTAPRLGGLSSYGLNCASCHVAEIRPAGGGPPVRVIGTTGHFDAEAFFGAVVVAGWRTADVENMRRFMDAWIRASDVWDADPTPHDFATAFDRQRDAVAAAIAEDPSGGKGVAPGAFQTIAASDFYLGGGRLLHPVPDLTRSVRAFLKLFHNMRAALHVPDAPPTKAPPASGPGRNDAFGLLAAALFHSPVEYAPVKYGVFWNAGARPWVHWDGNTRSPLGRNVLASLGLGAPLVGKKGEINLDLVKRHTELTQTVRPPKWPWTVDTAAAARGAPIYAAKCASCHDVPESDARLHDPREIGTDPGRARAFDAAHAELFNRFFREVEIAGFSAPAEAPIRSTGKYWAPSLDGVWARSPYLHNGSVRTMTDLLTPPESRPKRFRRGSRDYVAEAMGFADAGTYVFDAASPGNAVGGHAFGTDLDAAGKRDLVEYLKTR